MKTSLNLLGIYTTPLYAIFSICKVLVEAPEVFSPAKICHLRANFQ